MPNAMEQYEAACLLAKYIWYQTHLLAVSRAELVWPPYFPNVQSLSFSNPKIQGAISFVVSLDRFLAKRTAV